MTKAHSIRTLVVFVSCLLLAGGAFAAEMAGFGDRASWTLDDAAYGGTLTITGPDKFSSQTAFGAYEAPEFSVWNKAGYALADGQYNWNISLNAAKAERGGAASAKAASYGGSFRIQGGSIVVPKAGAGLGDSDGFAKDQVIADDLIVQGSACIGQDCSNGESFGFDTLRLKENNLRIKAQDTSNSASFPTVDWQLTFNESDNGGANKFSIDDIDNGRTPFTIEAGASSNSLYVDDAGNIGVGTNAPVVEVHIKDGDTPTLRLEQDGSSGFQSQTWDLAGNETNFFLRDVSNGSKLPFRVYPNAPTDSLAIEGSTGDIGMGTNSPTQALHVKRTTGNVFARIETSDAAGNAGMQIINDVIWNMTNEGASGNYVISLGGSGVNEFSIDDADGAVTVNELAGTGNASVCVDSTGKLFRGSPGC